MYPSENYSKECIMSAVRRSSRFLNPYCLDLFQYDAVLTLKNHKLGMGVWLCGRVGLAHPRV